MQGSTIIDKSKCLEEVSQLSINLKQSGFLVIILGCIEEIEGTNGVITSPDYPTEYPDNLACQWNITVPDIFRVKIKFEDFQLEVDPQCFDRVAVSDGLHKKSPTLGKSMQIDEQQIYKFTNIESLSKS